MRTLLLSILLVAMLHPASIFAKEFGQDLTLSEETAISAIGMV